MARLIWLTLFDYCNSLYYNLPLFVEEFDFKTHPELSWCHRYKHRWVFSLRWKTDSEGAEVMSLWETIPDPGTTNSKFNDFCLMETIGLQKNDKSKFPCTPYDCSLINNLLCETTSNALLKSMYTIVVGLQTSSHLNIPTASCCKRTVQTVFFCFHSNLNTQLFYKIILFFNGHRLLLHNSPGSFNAFMD